MSAKEAGPKISQRGAPEAKELKQKAQQSTTEQTDNFVSHMRGIRAGRLPAGRSKVAK